jgi:hypothetical protein
MGLGMSKQDNLDFNGLITENISSTIPYLDRINNDAKTLVNRLYIPVNSKTLINFNETENYDLYKLFEKSSNTNNDNNFSETSPFISSDIYNHLVNKNMKGGNPNNDNESSTTSDEDSPSSNNNKRSKKSKKRSKKDTEETEDSDEDNDNEMEIEEEDNENNENDNDDNFTSRNSSASYISSSAHTESIDSSSQNTTTVSDRSNKKYYKNRNQMSDSIRTSDINIISVDS